MLSTSLFLVAYIALIFLWIQLKPYYGLTMAHIGTRLAAWTPGFRVQHIEQDDEIATVTLTRPLMTKKGLGDFQIELKLSVSNYSFNVPLTFALVISLSAFFHWRKHMLLEVSLFLFLVHLLYVFSFCSFQLYYQLAQAGIKVPSRFTQYFIQFLWGFTDNMIIRFESFLVIAYLWLRNQNHDKKRLPRKKRR